MSLCKSCGARIRWVQFVGGKRAPLDPAPSASGNVVIRGISQAVYAQPGDTGPRYTVHFATCPNAAQHRQPRRGQR